MKLGSLFERLRSRGGIIKEKRVQVEEMISLVAVQSACFQIYSFFPACVSSIFAKNTCAASKFLHLRLTDLTAKYLLCIGLNHVWLLSHNPHPFASHKGLLLRHHETYLFTFIGPAKKYTTRSPGTKDLAMKSITYPELFCSCRGMKHLALAATWDPDTTLSLCNQEMLFT